MKRTTNGLVKRLAAVAALVVLASFATAGLAGAQSGYQLDGVTPGDVTPGSPVHVHSNGWCAGGSTSVTLAPSLTLGSIVGSSEGIIDGDVTIPSDTSPGAHDLALSGTGSDCTTAKTQVLSFTVVSSKLAFTGSDVGMPLAIGVALVIIGTTAFFGAKRRRAAISA